MPILRMISSFIVAFFREGLDLVAENIALRQQLAGLKRSARAHACVREIGSSGCGFPRVI